ncbi:MAG: helix-turn-helix transcriptional regulator [Clostridia bacterium]|nr:helix-turn-helix transcriptional regulator [Clostridia bacterium]
MKPNIKSTDLKRLGEMLKKLRKEHGYSQTVVAEYLDVDRSTYTKYELGRALDIMRLAKISALYNVSADSLISVLTGEAEEFSKTVALNSTDKKASVYILDENEKLLIDYYRNSLRKDTILDFSQSICLEDSLEDDEDN